MTIPKNNYATIKNLNVNEHTTLFQYSYWEKAFIANEYLLDRLRIIKDQFHNGATRDDLVSFYRKDPKQVSYETKFLASMIWGHEAPAGSRRDSRGPWKVTKMFANPTKSEDAISKVSIESEELIKTSYRTLDRDMDRCGPNFFTKHFYFLPKSKPQRPFPYPVIFDDRVATGLMKISPASKHCSSMVRISAERKPDAYLAYLNFVSEQAAKIECDPDQVEYFLFCRA